MKNITINCAEIADKAAFHQALAKNLAFPEWYGNNLDALSDCLTDLEDETHLTLQNWQAINHWAASFRVVLEEAEESVPELTVTFA